MKSITIWLRSLFKRPDDLDGTEAMRQFFAEPVLEPETEPYVPMTEAERIAAGDIARAERAAMIAQQARVNPFQDPPEVCAARAADPAWQEEQRLKREASSDAFVAYRRDKSGLPLLVKGRY
jgi:hypothetical protein